jgi:ubiquinone/menaquinone biosynthesis C-methylase UbiE
MDTIYDHNFKVYSDQAVCNSYVDSNELQAPEREILSRIGSTIADKKILDIGIGTGRTTQYLLEYTRDYTGIDYSGGMVKKAKEKFGDARILQMDARNLQAVDALSLDFVFFSFNGIDYMNHSDRMKCLQEITRVIKVGGLFAFSTHNLGYLKFNQFVINAPKFSIPYFKRLIKGGINRLRNVFYHVHTDAYSIITDPGHDYNCLTYYISPDQQVKQLKELGFQNIQMFGRSGKQLDTGVDGESAWIYYLAQK